MNERPVVILEKHIEEACVQIMEFDGWIVRKMEQNYSERKRKVIGEPGMADRLAIRYIERNQGHPRSITPSGVAEVLWIEFKRPRPSKTGKTWRAPTRAAIHQQAWHLLERKRGALTLIAGCDFPASIEGFTNWYRNSGLMRRTII